MHLVFSIPGAPRGRGKIERFFGTVNWLLLSTLPGYPPAGTAPPEHPILTLSALDAHPRTFIIENCHQRPRSETSQPPQARWEAGGFLPHLPASLEQLESTKKAGVSHREYSHDDRDARGRDYVVSLSEATRWKTLVSHLRLFSALRVDVDKFAAAERQYRPDYASAVRILAQQKAVSEQRAD